MVVLVLLVDGGRFGQLGQSFPAELLKAAAILRLASAISGTTAGGGLAMPRGVGIDFAAQVQGDQPLHIGHVIEGASHVAMPRVAFLVVGDRPGKTVNGVLIASLAACNPAVRRMNVAQGEMVIRLAQDGLGLLQDVKRLFESPF